MLQFIALLPALAGVGLAGYAWAAEGTGVTGTAGALLALIGALAALLGLAALAMAHPTGRRRLIVALSFVAALLTAVAAWFLMQDALAIVMALVVLTILVVAARPPLRTAAP